MTDLTARLRQDSRVVDAYPISRMQLGMIAESDRGSDRSVYWDEAQIVLDGAFDLERFSLAVDTVIAAHPALRTTFDISDFSVPVQLVHDVSPHDVISTGGSWESDSFDDRLSRPFRIRVEAQSSDRTRVTIGFHHAVMDGWSLSVVTSELLATYDSLLDGGEPAASAPETLSREFVALELEAASDAAHREHWVRRMEPFRRQALAFPDLGVRHVDPEPPVELVIDAERVDRLSSFAAQQGMSLRSVMFSIHLGALSLVGEGGLACTGYVSNGRPESEDAMRGVGVFLNTLPLSADVTEHSWRSLAEHVHGALSENERFRRFPLGSIADSSPWFSGFETFVDYRDFQLYGAAHAHLSVADSSFAEQTEIPLSVAYRRSRGDGTIGVRALYDERKLRREWVADLLSAVDAAIDCAVSDPDRRVADSDLVPVAAPESTPRSTTVDNLLSGLSGFGAATAIDDEEGILDYAGLDAAAEVICQALRSAGACDGIPVALRLRRSRRHVAAMLGALRARAPFVPLDLASPTERLDTILRTAQCAWILTDDPKSAVDASERVLVADGVWLEHITRRDEDERAVGDLDGAAYVIFTSGSTGVPKGVVVTRANLGSLLDGVAERIRLEPGDRALASTAFTFDISLVELLLPLTVGAAVVVAAHGWDKPEGIAGLVDRGGLRVMQATPSCWRLLLDLLQADHYPMIAVTAGEVLHGDLAAALVRRFETVQNGYGPTEATIYTTMAEVVVPPFGGIGTVLDGVEARVVDLATRRTLPVGAIGELWLAGDYLAAGYVGRPEETAARFVEHRGVRWYRTGDLALRTDSVNFQVVGRIDNQVKIDGVRIELEEVEAALERQDDIEAAVCLVEGGEAGAGGARIVALVQLAPGSVASAESVRRNVRAQLPASMVPAVVNMVARIPVSSAGKKDRRAAGELDRHTLDQAADVQLDRASTDDETAMLEIFRDVFADPSIQLGTRFRDAGGTSMLALRIRMAVWQRFERELTVGVLFANPTVGEAAAAIRDDARDLRADQVVALNGPVEGRTLLMLHPLGGEVGAYLDLAASLEGTWQVLAIQAPEFVGGDGSELTTIEEIAAEYRRVVDASDMPPVTAIGGWCMGATLAYEMWRQWAEDGKVLPAPLLISGSISEPVPVAYATDDVAALLGAFGWRGRIDAGELACMTKSARYDRVLQLVLEQDSTRPGVREHEELDRLVSLYHRHAVALIDYTATGPRWIPDAVLIRAEDEAWGGTFGWEKWVDELHTSVLPGAHDTLLEKPYLDGLRHAIEGNLRSAQTEVVG